MKLKGMIKVITLLLVICACLPVGAVVIPPVPTEPIYFEPHVIDAPDEFKHQSCAQLDNNIRYLQPYKYSYKPNYYQDNSNKLATAMITVDVLPIVGEWLGFAYLGYSALVEEKENRRILLVKQQIAMFQQLKSEKHCFE